MNGKSPVTNLLRSDLARATGCNLETIRYYETIGVMPDPPRTAKGFRVYGETHVQRLSFVMRMRELGYTLEEVRGFLTLVDGGTQTCAEVLDRTKRQLAVVRTKIADLRRIEKVLAETAAQCSGDEVPECPVLDALSD
jgi:Hg(II)-responsive transcriptional regulator